METSIYLDSDSDEGSGFVEGQLPAADVEKGQHWTEETTTVKPKDTREWQHETGQGGEVEMEEEDLDWDSQDVPRPSGWSEESSPPKLQWMSSTNGDLDRQGVVGEGHWNGKKGEMGEGDDFVDEDIEVDEDGEEEEEEEDEEDEEEKDDEKVPWDSGHVLPLGPVDFALSPLQMVGIS